MYPWTTLLGYFSPETVLPLSSIIATLAGCALLIKRSSLRFLAHCCRTALRRRRRSAPISRPHLPGRDQVASPGSPGRRVG